MALKGQPLSEETKAKISAANRGKKRSDEVKAKMSAAQKGKKHSEKTKAKMSAAHKGKKPSDEARANMSLGARTRTHGHYGTRTYRSWQKMRERCSNPNTINYARYGGRGISVCPEWDDFAAFLADMGERPEGMTLDRIDNDGNYEPSNCRWATPVEQRNNRG